MEMPVIVFGDTHGAITSLEIILAEARSLGIHTALNLGDEASFTGGAEPIYDALRAFRDEGNTLACVFGNHSYAVPHDLLPNYAGAETLPAQLYDEAMVYQHGTIFAGHIGSYILDHKRAIIENPPPHEPVIIFHGHSHSMGVLPEYKWLSGNEFVPFIPEGTRKYQLAAGKAHWINPGISSQYVYYDSGMQIYAANFAIYDPAEQTVTLRSKFFGYDQKHPDFYLDSKKACVELPQNETMRRIAELAGTR